jgi:hypothetical protein
VREYNTSDGTRPIPPPGNPVVVTEKISFRNDKGQRVTRIITRMQLNDGTARETVRVLLQCFVVVVRNGWC